MPVTWQFWPFAWPGGCSALIDDDGYESEAGIMNGGRDEVAAEGGAAMGRS